MTIRRRSAASSGPASATAPKRKAQAKPAPPPAKLARPRTSSQGDGTPVGKAPLGTVGTRLLHARLTREIKMRDLAAAAGCSESLISKIENNKVVPSLNVLHRLAEVLGLTLGELLSTTPENEQVVTQAGARRVVDIDSLRRGTGIRMERLVPYAKGHLLQGNIHVIAPGGSTDGTLTHDGEEVGYVISGEIELWVGEQRYRLSAGDSFCYRSEIPHGYSNRGTEEARVLFVNTPPTF